MSGSSQLANRPQEDSTLIDDQDLEALRENIATVLATTCDSRAVHAFFDGKSDLDQSLWATASELGWLAVGVPEADDGLGLGPKGLDVLHRELGRRAAPGPFIATLAAAQWLAEVADEAQRKAYLPRIISGQLTVAIPAVVNSATALSLNDGRLTGGIQMLGSETAGLALVPVGFDGNTESWALVDCDVPGVAFARRDVWDRTRQACALTLEGVEPAGLVADVQGLATRILSRHLALAVASDSLGAASGISSETIEYMKTRVQFDKPIGSFQALKHRAADLVVRILSNEHLLAQAVEAAATQSADADMWAALAKAESTDGAVFVAGDCVQLFGGVGHTWEFDCHIYLKRARLDQNLCADNRLQRDLAAHLLADATRNGRNTTELGL